MAFGRTLFKATNWLLFVLGTLMALHAGYMIFRYQQEQQDPTGPSDSPPAAPPQETPFRGSDLWFAPNYQRSIRKATISATNMWIIPPLPVRFAGLCTRTALLVGMWLPLQ